jgi:hypothetical protein
MSDEQLKAKNWDMLQEAKALRSRRAALENEWNKFAESWGKLAQFKSGFTIRFDEENITVLNPSQRLSKVDTVPQAHFDVEAMKRLRLELDGVVEELDALAAQLRDLGVEGC